MKLLLSVFKYPGVFSMLVVSIILLLSRQQTYCLALILWLFTCFIIMKSYKMHYKACWGCKINQILHERASGPLYLEAFHTPDPSVVIWVGLLLHDILGAPLSVAACQDIFSLLYFWRIHTVENKIYITFIKWGVKVLYLLSKYTLYVYVSENIYLFLFWYTLYRWILKTIKII